MQTQLKSEWIGLKGAYGRTNLPVNQTAMIPIKGGDGSNGNLPPLNPNGGGGNNGSPTCPESCKCHPMWYVGSAVGVAMLLTALLARS